MSTLQLQKVPLRQVPDVRALLMNEQARDQLSAVATKHMNPERMMRVVANAIRTTPKLQECEPMSFLGALMQCAALGLEPNTILGHAYLIPFENRRKQIVEVQLVVGYKGLIDLARRSGHITSIHAGIHYDDDEKTGGLWEYEEGTEARLRHRNGDMNGKKSHAYAIAKFKDGGHAYVVMPWSHVMRIRDASQGYQQAVKYGKKDTPWIAHEDAMAKKTAIRALSKYLPLSVEFVDAITVDEKRPDYRAFAMDPTSGIAPLQEDYIEGEVEETGEVEQNKAPDPVLEQKQSAPVKKAEPEPKRPTRAELQQKHRETQAAKPKPQEDPAPKEEVKPEQDKDLFGGDGGGQQEDEPAPTDEGIDPYGTPFGTTFLQDVADMGIDDAMGFHGEQVKSIAENDPDFHAALIAEANRIAGAE